MNTYVFYGYSADVLVFNPNTGAFELDADYDLKADRIKVTITDDDAYFDGDRDSPNVGEDANQTAKVETPGGELIASGQLYDDAFAELETPDGGNVWIERLEIEGVHLGYFSSEPLVPGQSYPVSFSSDVDDNLDGEDTRLQYQNLSSVPCFGPATSVDTTEGPIPVEWLTPGMEVKTHDKGIQKVVWTGEMPFSQLHAMDDQRHWPIVIPADAIRPGVPDKPVTVSPQHRVLVRHPFCELYFGEAGVFVAAKHLVGLNAIAAEAPDENFAFHHVVLASHDVINTHGLESECLFYCKTSVGLFDLASRRGLARAMRPHGFHQKTARRCLSAAEAEVLRDALVWPVLEETVNQTA